MPPTDLPIFEPVTFQSDTYNQSNTYKTNRQTINLCILGPLSWILFSVLFLAFIKLLMAGSLEKFFFHRDAPYYMFLNCVIGAGLICLIKRHFGLLSENSTSTGKDFLILFAAIPFLAFITTFEGIVLIEKIYFGKNHTYYNWVIQYLVDLVVQSFVVFSCVSYFYVTAFSNAKERLLVAQKAQSEMQLKLLQQKVDPHFLFNNLNVLSSFVEKNPRTAAEFLAKLAELYRYILQTQHVEVVPIKEELDFSQNYLYLIKQRFGEAYNFDWQVPPAKLNGQMIIPAALQSLLENVVKHNAGDQKKPLKIQIAIEEDFLIVENEMRPKSHTAHLTSGTGLQNLETRYAFMTEQPVEVIEAEKIFKVKLPLLKLKK